jgi:RNA polymerase-binding transcription factor
MPSKKPNKVAKRPGKATPKKAAHKPAAAKKLARPSAKPTPLRPTSKVTVKPNKPVPKPVIEKPVVVKPVAEKVQRLIPEAVKPSNEKIAPIKFDTRPLVMTRIPVNDEESDGESAASASLLAGPRNVKPYIARRGEQYMNKEQLEHFARILQNWKRDLMVEVDRTVLHMKDEAANFPDPNDRATQEEEFSLELRTRDRERKLIRKIDEALKRIEDGSYGYCLETGEEIGIKRLEARPVATLSVEAQERRERREKQYGDRDDRYR